MFLFPYSMLPKAVKRRVHALKRLQVQCANIEAKFYEEVHELERKYAALYQPLFDKVQQILFLITHFLKVILRNTRQIFSFTLYVLMQTE